MAEPQFNAPPGWPPPPPGWRPYFGWQPDPSWPPAPDGWPFWVVPPKKPVSPWIFTVTALSGALAIILVLVLVWVANQDRPVARPNPDIPVFSTLEESLAYYEGEKTAARTFVDENPFGYDFERVESLIADLDPKVAAEATSSSPDLAAIAGWGYGIHGLIGVFTQSVDRWETTFSPKPELLTNASGTAAEAALDTVSGGVSDIVFDDSCGSADEALACAFGGTVVHVPSELRNLSDAELTAGYGDFWMSVMAHEYAHIVQNKYIYRFLADADYQRLFVDIEQPADADEYDVPIEYSADCMGVVLLPDYVPGYLEQCTPEQLAFATTVWDGSFVEG
jgi:hypothetical protein